MTGEMLFLSQMSCSQSTTHLLDNSILILGRVLGVGKVWDAESSSVDFDKPDTNHRDPPISGAPA